MLRRYQAFYGSDELFDRAFYIWENDTTVAIGLHDTENKKSVSFKVFGYGTTTGLE